MLMKYFAVILVLSNAPTSIQRCYEIEPLEVKRYGVFNIERDDVGMVIYLEVINTGSEVLHIVTKMIECCETITNEDSDCQFIHLLGGNMGFLSVNKTRNFTLIFPNMYPYNRKGECEIAIWYRGHNNISKELRQHIEFNTYVSATRVPQHMKDFAKPWEFTQCSSPDQDPLDNCLPVNCHMKYSGYRSFYNHITLRCDPIPVCRSNPKKEMPDVAYVPMSNTCRDLETAITEEDVHFLTKNEADTQWKVEPPPLVSNLRCHHGHMDNESGFCVCDAGWTSTPFDRDQFNPSTVLYHMCTIQQKSMMLRRIVTLIFQHYPTIMFMNILMSICLVVMIFFGHSFIVNYEIARIKSKGKKYVPICVLINILIKLAVNVFIINFLVSQMEEPSRR